MNIKKLLSLLLAVLLILSLAACSAQGGDKTQSGDESYSADAAFTFSDSGIKATGSSDGYEIDGTHLAIKSAGTYSLSGSCADGSIEVKKGTTGVTLILNGLELDSADTAPISCNKSTEVTIVAADGSVNALSDSAENNDDEYPDNENAENAVIKCKDGSNVTLCGTGTINITANGKNGIKSGAATGEEGDASLTIKELTLNISAKVNDAINAEQLLNIESGTLNISAADDAVHCDLVLNIGADGTDGPTIDIAECYEGLEAAELNVLSGNISGGTINAYSSEGDGFDSNGDLNISGGIIAVWTANRADNQPLDADGTLNISGGTVLAAGASNGMGLSINAEQAYATFSASGQLISKGDVASIKSAGGSDLFSAAASCDASFVFFSSPELDSGSSYSLYAGDSSAAASTAQTGTASAGGNMGGGMQPGAAPDGGSGKFGGDRPTGTPPEKPRQA